LTRESRHWGEFAQILGQELPDAKVVALDLPGNGRLHHLKSPWSMQEMATHCRKDLLAQRLRPPYYLLAMSLGAMVAVAWANQHPEELLGCVLINTSLRPFSPFYRRLRLANYPTLLALALRAPTAAQREQAILQMTSHHMRSRSDVLAKWHRYARECPVSRANAVRQLLAAARYRAPADKPAPPLLILASAADCLVDPRCSRQLAASWKCEVLEHPTAGHDLPLDDGPWVASKVHQWLKGKQPVALTSS
jgi:pimeloyl-ACP methyl ester carboxylesterase